ncbi:hypothetical protein ER57_07945 [Smithella sp. SCADC]|nr:hypothetical protein ER57_07945 [Smithella sp. SCADC]
MGTNFIQPGVDIKLATGSGLSANDPFLYGDFLPCVLMTDAETASPYYAVCRTSGVFDLSVKANNGSASAVAVGDQIFYTAESTPKLDKVATGKPFGVALEAIGSGETATIQVRLNGFYFPDGAIATDDLADDAVTLAKLYAIAQGSIIVGGADNAPTALAAKTSGQILIGDGTDLKSVAMSGDVTIGATGATTIGAGKVESSMLANGAGVAALLTAGLGGSVSVTKTDAATTTVIAANATKDRACLVLVTVDETYAIGTGTLPTVKIGEDDTIEKCMAGTVLDDEAAGTVLAFAFTNTATKKIIVTTTAAVGDSTGGCSITVLAIPTT